MYVCIAFGAMAELRKLRGEHALVLEMLGEREERVVELEALRQSHI